MTPPSAWGLEGRIAVVTGATRGIGRAIATALALEGGAEVVAVGRDGDLLESVVAEIVGAGGKAIAVPCDVTSEEQVIALAEVLSSRYGAPDVLVNNAGVVEDVDILDMSVEQLRRTLEVNVVGTFMVSRELGRLMVARASGSIINLGSIDGMVGVPGLSAYCASKGAVIQLTRAMAVEWARHKISVNALCPGYILTDINRSELEDAQLLKAVVRRIPFRRVGETDELLPWVLTLASPRNSYMTGQTIVVDGGQLAH